MGKEIVVRVGFDVEFFVGGLHGGGVVYLARKAEAGSFGAFLFQPDVCGMAVVLLVGKHGAEEVVLQIFGAAVVEAEHDFLILAGACADGGAFQGRFIGQVIMIAEAVGGSGTFRLGKGLHEAVCSVLYQCFPALYSLRDGFQRDVAMGSVQAIVLSLVIEKADGMIDGGKRGHFVGGVGDVVCADINHPGIEALCPEQGAEQQRHAFAVAVAFAQHLGGTVGLMACKAAFEGYVADILLHVGVGAAYLLHIRGASGGDFCQQRFCLGEGAVYIRQPAQPAVHILGIRERTRYQQMRVEVAAAGRIVFFLHGGQCPQGVDKDGVAFLVYALIAPDAGGEVLLYQPETGEGGGNGDGDALLADEVFFRKVDLCKVAQVVKGTAELYTGLFALPVQIEVEVTDAGIVEEYVLRRGIPVDGFGGEDALGPGIIEGDEFAVIDVGLHFCAHAEGLVFGFPGVVHYDVGPFFHKNIAVFTAVDDNIVVHRLAVKAACYQTEKYECMKSLPHAFGVFLCYFLACG